MLSSKERVILKAELERLQKAQRECTDGGIREKIDAWVEEHRQTLQPRCPICRKPCTPEESVTDVEGRALHKKCYRDSRISTH